MKMVVTKTARDCGDTRGIGAANVGHRAIGHKGATQGAPGSGPQDVGQHNAEY